MSDKYVIMFVCTGNTCRSPMAEGALRVLLDKERPDKFEVISSGTHAASHFPATIYAIEAARIWDADLSKHQSQPLTRQLIDKADLILGMTESHVKQILKMQPDSRDKTFLFKNFPGSSPEGEEVEDPIGRSLDVYNQTFIEIGEHLGQQLDEFVRRIDEKIE
ncbi:MAG TPA: low molecular weight protein arginine phosphatase [candidate division Zixibacteria bacterium]|nr:low molecular weight protein arginine phosphatase [candidate division Zixibacteria bacterium]